MDLNEKKANWAMPCNSMYGILGQIKTSHNNQFIDFSTGKNLN